jgi:hypothetical protein
LKVKSLTSICFSLLKDFAREIQTVEFFTLRQNGNKKYSTKRSDAKPKEQYSLRPGRQQTREMACRGALFSSEK